MIILPSLVIKLASGVLNGAALCLNYQAYTEFSLNEMLRTQFALTALDLPHFSLANKLAGQFSEQGNVS